MDGLTFGYGKPLLRDVGFTVGAGEAVALLGRNGSGKSTPLRCLIWLLRIEEGIMEVNGRLTTNLETADICREAAYLPQNPDDLLFADSVVDELHITLQNHGLAAGDLIERTLDGLGLTTMAAAYPRDLSVGQRQRVALAALIADRTLILDDRVIVAEGKTAVVLSNAPDFAPQMVRLLPNQGGY